MPERIQLRRTKGWSKPAGAVYVGRGTPWGNPFPVETRSTQGYSRPEAVRRFRIFAEATAMLDPSWLGPLRGKDLACWCKLDAECHADVLLEIANTPKKEI